MNAGDILKRIKPRHYYIVLKKKISEELAASIDKKLQIA